MTITEVDFLTEIDFDLAPPCQHTQHYELSNDAPAAYLILSCCPGCPDRQSYLICSPCYKDGLAGYLECGICEYVGLPSEMWKVIQVL